MGWLQLKKQEFPQNVYQVKNNLDVNELSELRNSQENAFKQRTAPALLALQN